MRLVAVFITALIPSLASLPASAAPETETRTDALAKYLQSFCLSEAPSWQGMNALAAQQQLKVDIERNIPLGPSQSVRQKTWLVGSPSGEFQVMAGETSGMPNQTVTCGLIALDVSGQNMARSLRSLPSLRTGATAKKGAADEDILAWSQDFVWGHGELQLAWNVPGQPGVVVTLIYHPSQKT